MFLAALVGRSLARAAGIFAGIAAVLAGVQVVAVLVAAAQEQSQAFDLIARLAPAFVQQQFGSAFPAFLSFPGLVTFGYFHPVVMLLVALFAAFVATEIAADIEGGQVDLLLARPFARHWLVTRSLVVVLVSPLVFVSVMIAFTTVALHFFAPANATWPEARVIGLMGAHLVAIAWCVGAFGLAVGSAARRRSSALAIAAIVAVALYLVELLGGAWRPFARARLVSPFHYYNAPAILAGRGQVGLDLGVLAGMTALCVAIAYWRFNTRDV